MPKPQAVICAAVRTTIGTYGGTLKDTSASGLGARAIQACLERAGLAEILVGNGWSCRIAIDAPVSDDLSRVTVFEGALRLREPTLTNLKQPPKNINARHPESRS